VTIGEWSPLTLWFIVSNMHYLCLRNGRWRSIFLLNRKNKHYWSMHSYVTQNIILYYVSMWYVRLSTESDNGNKINALQNGQIRFTLKRECIDVINHDCIEKVIRSDIMSTCRTYNLSSQTLKRSYYAWWFTDDTRPHLYLCPIIYLFKI